MGRRLGSKNKPKVKIEDVLPQAPRQIRPDLVQNTSSAGTPSVEQTTENSGIPTLRQITIMNMASQITQALCRNTTGGKIRPDQWEEATRAAHYIWEKTCASPAAPVVLTKPTLVPDPSPVDAAHALHPEARVFGDTQTTEEEEELSETPVEQIVDDYRKSAPIFK